LKTRVNLVNTVVKEIVGEDVVPLVALLKGGVRLSEFELAKKIDKEVNETRTLLYKLYEANLVNFMKKREKKSGWYVYYWKFNTNMVEHLFNNLNTKHLTELRKALVRETETQFFSCINNCTRLDFETATTLQFKCPECGGAAEQEDNSEKIKYIEQQIKNLEDLT